MRTWDQFFQRAYFQLNNSVNKVFQKTFRN